MGKPGAVRFGFDLLMPLDWTSEILASQVEAVIQTGQDRYDFFRQAGYTDGEALGWAVFLTTGDFVGYTPIAEAIAGVDSTNGSDLSGWQRAGKLGLGVLATLGTAVGAAPLVGRTTQLLPQFGARFSALTRELGLLNEAGFVRIGTGTQVAARNNAAILVPERVLATSAGTIDTFTVGELRQLTGMKEP